MVVYIGTSDENFKVKAFLRSRYGIPALFFASKPQLAQLYAAHYAEREFKKEGGFVFECELDCDHIVSFGGRDSYCGEFRSLIYRLCRQKYKAVRITGVMDYPDQSLKVQTDSDVIAVFDLSLIKNLKLIQKNVRLT